MRSILRHVNRRRAMAATIMAATIGVEVYLVFINRDSHFRIEGLDDYDISEFGSGAAVSHAFQMRGDGLNAVNLRFTSQAKTVVSVQWTLWRGFADQPQQMTRAFEGVESLDLRPGRQWKTFAFTRDASSRDRWYTIEVRLQHAPRLVALVASRDNPERGGVLFVNGVRQSGSLSLRAQRHGRTLYRRFVAEVEPHLPPALRIRAIQWTIVVLFHWAFFLFAFAVTSEANVRVPAQASP
jgi:hypothetical protein